MLRNRSLDRAPNRDETHLLPPLDTLTHKHLFAVQGLPFVAWLKSHPIDQRSAAGKGSSSELGSDACEPRSAVRRWSTADLLGEQEGDKLSTHEGA